MEMDPERRALAAAELQNSPVFQEAISELKAHCADMWEGTDLTDSATREIAFMRLTALKDVEAIIQNWSRNTERKG